MVTKEEILAGKVGDLPQIPSKVVRIFVSSTFSDTTVERNYLMEHVYPQLQKYCMAKHGLEFQVIDMRWGILDEAQDDHQTSELCLKEIETCKRLSVGPNFVVLLGNKYGYRPFPACISADEFEILLAALKQEGVNTEVLETWFSKDENAVPPFYRLLTISKLLKHYNDTEDEDLKKEDRSKWAAIFGELQQLLRTGSKLCAEQGQLSQDEVDKYFISVTEQETTHGILEQPNAEDHCLSLARNIQDIATHLKHPKAHRYVDMMPGELHRDVEAQKMLIALRDEKIPEKLSSENILKKTLYWSQDRGINRHDHKQYIQELAEEFYQKMMSLIDVAMDKTDELYSDELTTEVLQHGILCEKRCSVFLGRERIVNQIKDVLLNTPASLVSQQPLVVFGESGCGKTSVMAKCAQMVHTWLTDTVLSFSPVVIMRFLGTTPKSSNIRQVLYSVCQQITAIYGEDVEDVPREQDQLVVYFTDILRVATEEKPLFIFLDSLDQLSHVGGAHRLNWLPRSVPHNCHIIVSTLPVMHGILPKAKRIYHQSRFVKVEPLEQNICMDILNSWMKQEGRQLTVEQVQKVEDAFSHCSLPLFTNLVFEEVKNWRSFTPLDECVLELTVKGCINNLFDKVELQYGKILTSHALAYLTASRNGLSDVEMNHLLSLDDHVLDEVFVYWFPPVRRIPNLLWVRIKDKLQTYFIEKDADGMTVNNWYHRQFGEVATHRYLTDPTMKRYIHSSMADFFLGKWGGGKRKPFKFTEHQMKRLGLDKKDSAAERLVPEQPMEYRIDDTLHYNLRMLNELPYHLIESNRTSDLHAKVLFNYSWIYHKVKALSVQEVLTDYVVALATSPELYKEARPLVLALRLAGKSLNQNPNSLPVELIGRLHCLVKEVRGRNVLSNIAVLLSDCTTKGLKHSALVPSHQCFEPPNPHLLFSLEGHKSTVCDLRFDENLPVLYSVASDNSIISWDTEVGEHISLLNLDDIELHRWTYLFTTDDGENLVCDTYTDESPLLVIDPATFEVRHKVGARQTQKYCNTSVGDRYVCRNGSIINMASGKEVVSLVEQLGMKDFCSVAIDEKNSNILVSVDTDVLIMDIDTLEVAGKLRGTQKPSCIVIRGDLAIVGYAVECNVRVFYSQPSDYNFTKEKHNFRFDFLQNNRTENVYRKEVSEIVLSKDKKRILVNIQREFLVSIKIRTQKVTLMSQGDIEDPCFFCPDYSADRMLVVCAEGHHLCVWDRKTGHSLAVVSVTDSPAIHKIAVSCIENRVATVTKADNNIKVWDLDKLKSINKLHLSKPLKYENPLVESAIQVRGDYVFIKKILPLTSQAAFHYVDYFGIDVVGISSGKRRNLLPYDKYGKLIDFSVSLDHTLLALLIEHKISQDVYILNIYDSKIVSRFSWEEQLEGIQISPGKQYLFLHGEMITLYSLAQKGIINKFKNWHEPVMTLSDSHVLARDDEKVVIGTMPYSVLKRFNAGFVVVAINLVPNNPRLLLASERKDNSCDVHFIDFISGTVLGKIRRVSKFGISDISKNGAIIVDKKLNVYSVKGMNCLGRIRALSDNIDAKLSFDGRYVYCIDKESAMVKAYHIENGKLIAECNLHVEPVSLKLAQFGYHIIIGCQDGRLVMLRLRDMEGLDTQKLFKDVLPAIASKAVGAVDNFVATLDPTIHRVYESVRFYVMPKLTPEILRQLKNDALGKSRLTASRSSGVSSTGSSGSCTGDSSACNLL